MQEAGAARVMVWSESAELVADVNNNEGSGPEKTVLNIQSWAPGIYFYRVILQYDSGRMEKIKPGKFAVLR